MEWKKEECMGARMRALRERTEARTGEGSPKSGSDGRSARGFGMDGAVVWRGYAGADRVVGWRQSWQSGVDG